MRAPNLPLASRDLPDERPVGGVVVEMPPAAALAEPEKRTVLQPDGIDARVLPSLNPRLARFPEDVSRGARFGARTVEVEPRLRAVLNLIHDVAAVRSPAGVDDEEIACTWSCRSSAGVLWRSTEHRAALTDSGRRLSDNSSAR